MGRHLLSFGFLFGKVLGRVLAKLCFVLSIVVLVSNYKALAQGAMISGQVVDHSGAVVAHAQIKFTNQQTKMTERTATDDSGLYSISSLTTGEYTLAVEAVGFAPYEQSAIMVRPGQNQTLNVTLKLGAVSQTVTVQGANEPVLLQVPEVGKTGTKLEDLPRSVQIVSRELVDAQGGIELKDALRNSSGVGQGGSDSFGFADRFLIRGLDARIYNDGFSDGDQRNGIPHSMNGVERVEILEGPGSSLFGSGPPGGTINMVHYEPSEAMEYGGLFQAGSFGLVSGNGFVTGGTGVPGLNFRVDGLAQHENGFRSLEGSDYELRPELTWTKGQHLFALAVDGRDIKATPDPAGLIYVNGTPIQGVSREAKYSTPFSYGNQTLVRTTAVDLWSPAPYVTIANRFSQMYRDLSILRNGDGGTVTDDVFSGRQLRKQRDFINDLDYEFEPVWKFKTGTIRHTLLTGSEAQYQTIHTDRLTADLPSITNIFDPVIPETSVDNLTFLRDAKHSGAIDHLSATYFGLYAADQIDVTDQFKLRLTGRQDWWNTDLTPQIFVPGRIYQGDQFFEPGVTYKRTDTPLSASAGALYRILPGISPFFGVATSDLATFSSESTQNGVHAPESALQYEAGVKVAKFDNKMTITFAAFDVKRNNVFTLVGDTPFFNDQKTKGAEINFQAVAWSTWKIFANVTAQNAELTDNPSNPAATGKHPVGVPQHIFNLWTEYDFRTRLMNGFKMGAGLAYRDSLFGDVLNTKSVPSYTTLDAVLSYVGRSWDASFGVRNITDTTYFIAANGGGGFVGDPRTYFVSLRRTFGSRGANSD
jgi:iron complex outermembrane recepter protein